MCYYRESGVETGETALESVHTTEFGAGAEAAILNKDTEIDCVYRVEMYKLNKDLKI